MSEQTPSQGNAAEVPARDKGAAGLFARISLTQMTLAALTVVFLWQWFDGQRAIADMRQQLAQKIAEMDGNSKASQMLLAQNQNEVRDLSVKLATLEARYAEAQNQRAALEALYNDLSAYRDETALAEVEQMLLIAGQQLQLSGNVKAALIAMQNADARLQRMERPALNGLRKTIGQDMDKLRGLPGVNVAELNIQLDGLLAAVDTLPLMYQQRQTHETAKPSASDDPAKSDPAKNGSAWQKLQREMWQEAKQLVRIENTGKADIPLLPPSQEFFLRENLKLRLLMARIALLSRDGDAFRLELKTAQQWLARYFDGKSNDTVKMQATLKKLAAIDVGIELPDIGRSLQAVRNYRLIHEGGAPEAARNDGKKAAR